MREQRGVGGGGKSKKVAGGNADIKSPIRNMKRNASVRGPKRSQERVLSGEKKSSYAAQEGQPAGVQAAICRGFDGHV